MKSVLLIWVLFPITAFAETLKCTTGLTNASTPLQVQEFQTAVTIFRNDLRFTQKVDGADFSYTITTGLTKDIMDDPDEPTFVGRPTLISLAIYNASKSQVARFDSYPLEVMRAINLTVGSAEQRSKFRIHVACQLK